MSRPFFSMPEQTVEKRISLLKPKINSELLKGKTDFERMVLEQNDLMLQHGETLARSADEQNHSLDIIQVQVLTTNGRMDRAEEKLLAHDKQLLTYKIIGGIALFILPSLGSKLLDFVLTKIHF